MSQQKSINEIKEEYTKFLQKMEKLEEEREELFLELKKALQKEKNK